MADDADVGETVTMEAGEQKNVLMKPRKSRNQGTRGDDVMKIRMYNNVCSVRTRGQGVNLLWDGKKNHFTNSYEAGPKIVQCSITGQWTPKRLQ